MGVSWPSLMSRVTTGFLILNRCLAHSYMSMTSTTKRRGRTSSEFGTMFDILIPALVAQPSTNIHINASPTGGVIYKLNMYNATPISKIMIIFCITLILVLLKNDFGYTLYPNNKIRVCNPKALSSRRCSITSSIRQV